MAILTHTFIFPGLKPFSVNASYVRTFAGVTKSSGASEYCAQIFNIMARQDFQQKLQELKSAFKETEHAFEVHMIAFYPESEFYTKKGLLSNRTIDISNGEKAILDCLWLPKFNEEPFPYGAPNLSCDDRFITKMISEKRKSHERRIEVTISVIEKP